MDSSAASEVISTADTDQADGDSVSSPSSQEPSVSNPNEIAFVQVEHLEVNNSAYQCSCTQHEGREMLNANFNISVDHVFECMFGANSEFLKKMNIHFKRHFSTDTEDWKLVDSIKTRTLNFTVELGPPFGTPMTIETQVDYFYHYQYSKIVPAIKYFGYGLLALPTIITYFCNNAIRQNQATI
ncbi:unnamed protein product [Sphagnum balticum]